MDLAPGNTGFTKKKGERFLILDITESQERCFGSSFSHKDLVLGFQ